MYNGRNEVGSVIHKVYRRFCGGANKTNLLKEYQDKLDALNVSNPNGANKEKNKLKEVIDYILNYEQSW